MNSLRWVIGDVEITQVVELDDQGVGDLIQAIIKDATVDNIRSIPWLIPHFADATGRLKAQVQAFVVKSQGKNILIDTCNGNHKVRVDVPQWGNLQTDFLTRLEEIGVTASDVHVVACTHLHMDHVGWNTTLSNGEWIPTFPNAQYLFARQEYEYWSHRPAKEIADDKAAFDDSVAPILAAGLATLVETNHTIDGNVRFIPTPGHTPAHVSVMIDSQQRKAIISGDLLHHPCQLAKPMWSTDSDTLPEDAVAARQRLLKDIAGSDTLLIGSHFSAPGAGRVVRHQDGFRLL